MVWKALIHNHESVCQYVSMSVTKVGIELLGQLKNTLYLMIVMLDNDDDGVDAEICDDDNDDGHSDDAEAELCQFADQSADAVCRGSA